MNDLAAVLELAAKRFEKPTQKWVTPGEMAVELDRRTKQTPALQKIDEALVELVNTPEGRLIITMPPQEGKSTRVAKDFPVWLLQHNPDMRVVTASYGQGLANRNGRAIRNTIQAHPELGIAVASDNGAAHEFQISGHDGGVLSVGIGSGVTGRPADIMIVDDPIKDRKEADSEVFRDGVWDWWTDAAAPRLAPTAPVVVILTRWHEDDLAGRLKRAEDGHLWRILNIPAQADHDPDATIDELESGQKTMMDPLDRLPGEFLESARDRTDEQWKRIKRRSGTRTWNALYQGRPSSAEGEMFKRDDWRFYNTPLWLERADGSKVLTSYDDIIMYWDMTFKDTEGTDMVAGAVWARRGADAFLLDLVWDRMDFIRTLREFRQLAAVWPQAIAKYVEDKANGPAVIAMLKRMITGIIEDEPHGSKAARAAAVTPLVQSHNVWLPAPEIAPWVGRFIEEHASFPFGANDDAVDTTSGALNRLVLMPLMAGVLSEDDLEPDLADFAIAPYGA